jgi:hypothetical protein
MGVSSALEEDFRKSGNRHFCYLTLERVVLSGCGGESQPPNDRTYSARAKGEPLRLSSTRELFGLTTISASRSRPSLDLRFDVLVQAKEVLRVVLLLDGHEPVVVGTERGFDRVFSLLTEEIQQVRAA